MKKRASGKSSPKVKRKTSGRRGPLERVIQRQILSWLNRSGLLYWRANAGALSFGTRLVRLGPKGMPDVVVILAPTGHFLGLECKRLGEYQNPDQRAFESKIKSAGGSYAVVRSLDEAKKAVEETCKRLLALKSTVNLSGSISDPWS